jgi:hypothetical protein
MDATAVSPLPVKDPNLAPMTTTNYFGTGENMTRISGEQTYLGFETTNTIRAIDYLQNNYDQTTTIASQDAMNSTATATTRTVRNTLNQDMRDHTTAASIANYKHIGGFFTFKGLPGIIDAVIKTDFNLSDKVLAGSTVAIRVPDGITAGTPLVDSCELKVDQPFNTSPSAATGFATFAWAFGAQIQQQGAPTFDTDGVFEKVTVQFQDVVTQAADGTSQADIAGQVKVTVDYSRPDGSGGYDTGTGAVIAPQV